MNNKNEYPKILGKQLLMTKGELLQGLAMCVLGLILIIFPGLTNRIVFTLIGAAIMLVGLVGVVRYLMMDHAAAVESTALANGLILIIAGVIVIVFKDLLVAILPLMFGLVILAGGIYKLQRALGLRALRAQKWFIELIIAVACIALGVLVTMDLFGTAMALTRVVGIGLFVVSLEGMISCHIFRKLRKSGTTVD